MVEYVKPYASVWCEGRWYDPGGHWPVCEGIKVGGGGGCHHRAGHGPRWASQPYLHTI